jgi:hypothetical protein
MAMTYDEARAALAAKTIAEQDLARLGTCPPWRHAAFAALETMLVASPLAGEKGQFAVYGVLILGMILIMRSDRRRLGVFINGYRRGRTRMVVAPILIIVLGLFALSTVAKVIWHMPLVSVAAAVITFPLCYYGSVIWQKVFLRELGL